MKDAFSRYPLLVPRQLNIRYCRHRTHVNSGKGAPPGQSAFRRWWTSWPSDQRINPCKPGQRPVRIDLYGVIMILPHGILKTWGEPCGARSERRCGVMTALPKATGNNPLSSGMRGKYGENASKRNNSAAPKKPSIVWDISNLRRGCFSQMSFTIDSLL